MTQRARQNGTHRGAQGFTLIELMVVVTIIAVLFALARPGMNNWRVGARHHDYTNTVVNMGRRAASLARRSGTAYIFRIGPSPNDARFGLTIEQGMTRKCRQTAWSSLDNGKRPNPIQYTTSESASVVGDSAFVLTFMPSAGPDAGTGVPTHTFCYEPNGTTYRLLAGPPATMWRQVGEVGLSIARASGNATTRWVSFPPAGDPRMRLDL